MTSVPPTQPPAAPETDVSEYGRQADLCDDLVRVLHNEGDGGIWEEFDKDNAILVANVIVDSAPVRALLADLDAARERVRVVEGERECECPTDDYCPKCHPRWYAKWVKREIENLRRWKSEALPVIDGLQDLGHALGLPLGERITGPAAVEAARNLTARAESAEAAHRALQAAVEALADDFDSNVDWSAGRNNYGDNEAWESAARQARALLAGGAS